MLTCRCNQHRPDHRNVYSMVNGIICMNWEGRTKSTNYMSRWSSRSSNGPYWSYTIGKGPYKSIIENQDTKKVGLSEMHRETEKPPLTMIDEKPTDGTRTSKKKKQDGHEMMKPENFLKKSSVHTLTEPRRRIEETFFCQMVMECWMEKFLDRIYSTFCGFRSHVQATTMCPGLYIHSLVARTLFCT